MKERERHEEKKHTTYDISDDIGGEILQIEHETSLHLSYSIHRTFAVIRQR